MSEALATKIAAPDTLAKKRLINQFLSEEPTTGDVNEGNLLSLNTLKRIYGGESVEGKAILAIQKNESKYLVLAMKLLTGNYEVKDAKDKDITKHVSYRLKSKYGNDLKGAMNLAKLLKTKADEVEFNSLIHKPVAAIVDERSNGGSGGFS